WTLFVLGLLLGLFGVLRGMVILPQDVTELVDAASRALSISGGDWGLLEAGLFLLVDSLVVFVCRQRKPFSMFLAFYLWPCYITLTAGVRSINGLGLPSFVPDNIRNTKPGLLFVLFILEVLLAVLLLIAVKGLDGRWKKRHDLNIRLLEKEGLIKTKEQLKEEKLLKKQQKLNEQEAKKTARENAKYQKELEKAAEKEKAKAEKKAEKDRKAYEKTREKEAQRIEAQNQKLKDKELKEQDKKKEKEEKELEKQEKLQKKEEKRRQEEEEAALAAEEKERKRREEEELEPAPEYAKVFSNPETPLSFPDFDPMPDLRNIVPSQHTVEENYDDEDVLKISSSASSSFMENLKSELEREEAETSPMEEEEEPDFSPLQFETPTTKMESKLETKRFSQGGMLEAALELYNKEQNEEVQKPTRPIIGISEPEPLPEETSSSSVAPSTLSPEHPRYRMFESLQNPPGEEAQKALSYEKSAENTASQAPSYLSPDHPRYKMFASLGSAPQPKVEEKKEEENFAPSSLPQSHPRYKMFEALKNNEVVKTPDSPKEKSREESSIAPSGLSTDHPRYRMFESLRRKDPVKKTEAEEIGVSHFPSRAFTPEDERVISHSYGSVSHFEEPQKVEEEPVSTVSPWDDEKEQLLAKLAPDRKPYLPPEVEKEEEPVSSMPLEEEKPVFSVPEVKENKVEETPQRKPSFEVMEDIPVGEEEEIPLDDDDEDDVEVEEEAAFVAPENPQIRSVKEKEEGHKVIQIKSEEGEAEDFNMVVGVGDLASNRAGYTAIKMRQAAQYTSPDMALLKDYPGISQDVDPETYAQGQTIVKTLAEQKLNVELSEIIKGPTVTMFELKLASASLITKFKGREDELSYALGGKKIRILAPISGKQAVGVEVPNVKTSIVGFKDMVYALRANEKYMKMKVPMILGKTITGEPIVIDVCKMPHMIIAGTTGSGKSVCINSLINSIVYQKGPKDVRLMMVDPKVVELTIYNGIPHLLTPVITDQKRAIKALDWLVVEMERRYAMLAKYMVRNIDGLNEKITTGQLPGVEKLPYIVMIMDEFADIMVQVGKEMDIAIGRIAAKARAAGIHLILATQRPSADVITGTLKSNLPARIAFAVSSGLNSRVILDEMGAETLLGKGDMLLLNPSEMGTKRIQGSFVSDSEVEAVVKFAYDHNPRAEYLEESLFEEEEPLDDDGGDDEFDDGGDGNLYDAAKKIVFERKSASASYLQRRLKIGYNRAARLVEMMEEEGIVGPANGSKPREVLRFD
ncbi:MAG: DNA translocase FtsK, partial [Spirochaetales bacterium]|nr:DNA translocase FtsK [Candidatus Physcosoma equi]